MSSQIRGTRSEEHGDPVAGPHRSTEVPVTRRAINPHLPAGAHALDALPDFERTEFEARLDRCQACAAESAGLQETALFSGAPWTDSIRVLFARRC